MFEFVLMRLVGLKDCAPNQVGHIELVCLGYCGPNNNNNNNIGLCTIKITVIETCYTQWKLTDINYTVGILIERANIHINHIPTSTSPC